MNQPMAFKCPTPHPTPSLCPRPLPVKHLITIQGGSIKNLVFQLHHAVHNVSKKPLGLFWQFRPSTSNYMYNNTLYYNLLQDLSIQQKTSDRAEQQFTQLLLSNGGQKTPWGKKSAGNLGRNHGSSSK